MKQRPIGINMLFKRTIITSAISLGMLSSAYGATLQDLQFASTPGGGAELRFIFDEAPPQPKSYTVDNPARIAMDLKGVDSALAEKYHKIDLDTLRSLTVVEANNTTRVILNLSELVKYNAFIKGNQLHVNLNNNVSAPLLNQQNLTASVNGTQTNMLGSQSLEKAKPSSITHVDFKRSNEGSGQIVIDLSDSSAAFDITERGGKIQVKLPKTSLPDELRRRLDVTDFATPVLSINAYEQTGNSMIVIEPDAKKQFEYMAYQTNGKLTIDVKPLATQGLSQVSNKRVPYKGEKLSLNFQDIEIRSVLQLIADFTGQNLVASDSVGGNITLRLQNVPWDQALDLVMKTKGLDKRKVGNVLLVAPADEIAERERLELENDQKAAELSPLRTEFIQVNYAKATDIISLLNSDHGLLSERGRASVDARTNTLIIKDSTRNLEAIHRALTILDIPVRQVLIEARIVIARTNVGEDIGVRWGGAAITDRNAGGANGSTTIGGSLNAVNDASDIAAEQATTGTSTTEIQFPDALVVDLGVADAAATTFAVGVSAVDYLIDLELSALETDGKAEIVSQPKVITADGQTARIESGTEIPFQRATSSGATSVEFKSAVLSLEVTPQITPDDRIIMDLQVNQDSVGEITDAGPSIDTNEVTTQVLVENGETIVLGGIYRTEEVEQITKTPLLGDLPIVGTLFRRTSYSDLKSELLVFITPHLVDDSLTIQ